jgi:hypothetical protein
MSELNNITLYIKRAELQHDKNYIINACHECRYGKVKDVKFIDKQDNQGKKYNGVIVMFEDWYNSSTSKQLFSDISASKDGSAKMYHDPIRMRYWHVIIFRPKMFEEPEVQIITKMSMISLTDGLNDRQQLEEMERKYNSMISQMHYMQAQLEKANAAMMEYERQHTQDWLNNTELKMQLEEKDRERDYELGKKNMEIEVLKWQNTVLKMDLEKKNDECEKLDQEVRDCNYIMNYMENETNIMKQMIAKSNM